MLTPLDVSPFVARLQSQCPAVLFVGRAASNMEAINQGPKVDVAAFVLEPNYAAIGTANFSGGTISQMTGWQIPIVTAVSSAVDATGADAGSKGYAARCQIFAAMLGWTGGNADGFAVRAGSGRLLTYKNNFLYYVDIFNMQTNARN